MAELFHRLQIRMPRTRLIHRVNASEILPQVELPVVLKKPDSSFSVGVTKAESFAELITDSSSPRMIPIF